MRINKRFILISCLFLIATLALGASLNSAYRLPILMYHSISQPSDAKDKLTVSPKAFARQMEYLRDKGYNVITLKEAVSYIGERKRPPKKTVAITIDDGYENNYVSAYPVLKRYGMPATIFVITGRIGDEGFMTWDEIRELSNSGIIDIESHTKFHKWLTGLDDETLKVELEDSKRILESRLGKEVPFVCYPMGGYDERVASAARAAGYKAAFGTKRRRISARGDPYAVSRVRISGTADNLFVFAIKISGYYNFFKRPR